ncbi:MAG TPA: hypothetical protein VHU41_10985, partial [Thermoanaerobaculia bacterium]|nr:hypothetical protein [Thermoanaerobaculia bacterium]
MRPRAVTLLLALGVLTLGVATARAACTGGCAPTRKSGYPTWLTVSFDASANFSGTALSIINSGIDY